MKIFSSDFETTTVKDDCRVWAWGYSDIDDPENVTVGNNITSFMESLEDQCIYYFHNLKFDGNFILYWLFKKGYKWTYSRKDLEPGWFTTSISNMGQWYTIVVNTLPNQNGSSSVIEFRDSAKLIPLSVEEIPSAYGLEESKLSLDYNKERKIGHELTQEEIDYISADIIIVAKALKFMINQGQTKLTAGANALNDFKQRYDKKTYKRLFPELNRINDKDIRKSYKGGWTYVNPKYRNKKIGKGRVYDINSMYPWAMRNCLLPYGKPVYFTGKYEKNEIYPLYVQHFACSFELKPGHFPSLQIKNNPNYAENEYIVKSLCPTVLSLTSVDYELFLENYTITDTPEYLDGYMFKAKHNMFTEYVDYWYDVKTRSKKSGNKGMEKIAKLMLNSLYGKFGARMEGQNKKPWFDEENDRVRYKTMDPEKRKACYLPIATFITSYCRDKIIRAANICGDRFIYADTDSIHIIGDYEVPGLDVDDYRLGAFKLESQFERATFIRQKTYLEMIKTEKGLKKNVKCCGMPKKLQNTVDEEDFYEGATFDHSQNAKFAPKLMPKVVPGGVILEETTFQIKKYEPKINVCINFDDREVFISN